MGELSGNGTYETKEGVKFKGTWKDGKKHGKGHLWMTNGEQIEGNWVNDELQGLGYIWMKQGVPPLEARWQQGIRVDTD